MVNAHWHIKRFFLKYTGGSPTSVSMRKAVATAAEELGQDDASREEVALAMGHSLAIADAHYVVPSTICVRRSAKLVRDIIESENNLA